MSAGNFVRYHAGVETIDPGEADLADKIIAVMSKGGEIVRKREGRPLRTSHAKAHAVLRGELRVLDALDEPYAQGLFAHARTYPVIVRMAHGPGELLDDRRVSIPRGLALKVLEVEGDTVPAKSEMAQDFLCNTGEGFIVSGPKAFLASISQTVAAIPLPEGVKAAVSSASRAGNAALNAFGLNSPKLDFFGHPFFHPLGESYFSQTPYRWGDYIAKIAIVPDTAKLKALVAQKIAPPDENGLRSLVAAFFRDNPAEFEVRAQLCADLDTMPVEDAKVVWPDDRSPYVPVGRLILPPQDAYADDFKIQVEGETSFCPSHALDAHRPLGGINRVRMKVYPVMAAARRKQTGRHVSKAAE